MIINTDKETQWEGIGWDLSDKERESESERDRERKKESKSNTQYTHQNYFNKKKYKTVSLNFDITFMIL